MLPRNQRIVPSPTHPLSHYSQSLPNAVSKSSCHPLAHASLTHPLNNSVMHSPIYSVAYSLVSSRINSPSPSLLPSLNHSCCHYFKLSLSHLLTCRSLLVCLRSFLKTLEQGLLGHLLLQNSDRLNALSGRRVVQPRQHPRRGWAEEGRTVHIE